MTISPVINVTKLGIKIEHNFYINLVGKVCYKYKKKLILMLIDFFLLSLNNLSLFAMLMRFLKTF